MRDIFTRSLSESYLNTGNKKIDSFVEPNIHAKHLDIADTGKEKPDINVAKHPAGIKKSRKLYLYQIFWLVMTLSFFASLFFSVGNYTTYQKETEEMSGNMADLKEGLGEKDPAHLIDSLKKIRQNVYSLKKTSESLGQELTLFDLMGGSSSKFSGNLALLNCVYRLFEIQKAIDVDKVKQAIGDSESGFIVDAGAIEKLAVPEISKILSMIQKDKEIAQKVDNAQAKDLLKYLSVIESKVISIQDFTQNDLAWLMSEKRKNIMVIFQNNSELRGSTGGSFGSFGIMQIEAGVVKKIDFGKNIFKIDNAYRNSDKPAIEAPDEIKVVSPNRWVLKDSGWALDGEEAFKNIQKFYSIETSESIDGVVTVDYTAFVSLLKIIGSIEMPSYGLTLNDGNFKEIIEDEVHNEYFQREGNLAENEPKKILADLMPIIFNTLSSYKDDASKFAQVFSAVSTSLKNKNILLYLNDKTLENDIKDKNFGGTIWNKEGDYLYVNNSNINGAKSSLSIDEKIKLTANITENGMINNSLEITRDHRGEDILPDGVNKNFTRIMIPQSSELKTFLPVKGNFEIAYDQGFKSSQPYWLSQEAGKSILNFWMNTPPGGESIAKVDYKPGYSIKMGNEFDYVINFQKQPGANPDSLLLVINYPKYYKPKNVSNVSAFDQTITLKFKLDSDKTIKINFQKNDQ